MFLNKVFEHDSHPNGAKGSEVDIPVILRARWSRGNAIPGACRSSEKIWNARAVGRLMSAGADVLCDVEHRKRGIGADSR